MSKNKMEIRTFELIKGLFITPQNYEDFESCFKKAKRNTKESFNFPNKSGRMFSIKVEYVEFVWNMMNKMSADEIIEKSKEFAELDKDFIDKKVSEDELIEKQTEMRDEAQIEINKTFK